MDAFDAYVTFLAARRHFSSDYDYFKYAGKVRANREKFLQRNDRYLFHKLSRKPDPLGQCVSVFLDDPDSWITKVISPDGDTMFSERKKRVESLTYNLSVELSRVENFDESLRVRSGQYPSMLRLYMAGSISPETMVVIDDLTGVFDHWDRSITDQVFWPDVSLRLRKYRPFLEFDRKALRQVIVDIFSKT